jgi:uncharacterized protein YjbI with pentapeptide repeats
VEQKKETRKRTRRGDSQEPTRQNKAWTLREFGGQPVWDWMDLLIVPLVLALVTFAFTWQQERRQSQLEDQRTETARQIEEQRAQDEALQAYLDQMSTLLLAEDLRTSEAASEVRTLARARTATVIQRLDADGNRNVIRFLKEANLTGSIPGQPSISLLAQADLQGAHFEGVDLSAVDLSEASLNEASLSDAYLGEAYLSGADLDRDDLRDANLSEARLFSADLSDANLSDASLEGVNLSGADLSRATGVTNEELE